MCFATGRAAAFLVPMGEGDPRREAGYDRRGSPEGSTFESLTRLPRPVGGDAPHREGGMAWLGLKAVEHAAQESPPL